MSPPIRIPLEILPFAVRWIAACTLAASLATGCARSSRPPKDTAGPGTAAVLSPAPYDTVAGEIRISAFLATSEPALSAAFLVDGRPVGVCEVPPWEVVWSSDAPSGGALRSLAVEVRFDSSGEGRTADTLLRSAAVPVWVLPDSAPVVRVTLPAGRPDRTRWIHREAGLFLEAAARDPEDGALPGERILWTGSALFRPLPGPVLPLELLPEGPQDVTAEAPDRWARKGRRTLSIAPFRYREEAAPQDCLENFRLALLALDAREGEARLDSSFCFVPCAGQAEDAGWEPVWDRTVFSRRLAAWLDDPSWRDPVITWSLAGSSLWSAGDGERAWIALGGVRFSGRTADPEFRGERGVTERAHSARAEARVLLGRAGGGSWRLLEWRETPGEDASLGELLARAAGMPAPSPRVRCVP